MDMDISPKRKLFVAGIIERQDNHLLIALPKEGGPEERRWCFPRGPATLGESPEAAVRRLADRGLGLRVEIVVGQPPLIARIGGEEVELRYFFCGVIRGGVIPGPYAELRWVPRHHLREYDFDQPSQPVVDWLLKAN